MIVVTFPHSPGGHVPNVTAVSLGLRGPGEGVCHVVIVPTLSLMITELSEEAGGHRHYQLVSRERVTEKEILM